MSSYGRGTATQFTGGGGGSRGQASYPTNANAAAARPSSEHHSYGAMAYPHIPSINESAEFAGNYADPLINSYQRQSQNPANRMNSNVLGDNRNYPAPNMDASAYNRHSNTTMQPGYSSMGGSTPNRRASVPPNVGMNSLSHMQRSHSYSGSSTDAAYSNRNSGMPQSPYPQPNMSNQSHHYGDGYSGYPSQTHNPSNAYNRTNSMMKSSEMWDRTQQSRMGQASFSNPHAMNAHFPHKAAGNQYPHNGMQQYPSSQTNPQMYAANNTSGMHSSSTDMNISADASVSSTDLGVRGNQCVNPGNAIGQTYGNNQAMYGSSMGGTNAGARMRLPNQRSAISGSMYNSMSSGGNQIPGSMQKLRHYGPMPNSSSGYSRTSIRPGTLQNSVDQMRNTAGSASSAVTKQGGWQGNHSHTGYASQYPQTQPNMSTNVPFNGLPPHNTSSNMQMQHMNYNNNMGMSTPQQQQTQNPRNYSGPVPSNTPVENHSDTTGMYGQGSSNTTQFPLSGCQEKLDSSSTEFSDNITAAETEAMIHQLNQDRIFSAELEKLARLSRNPTAEDFIADSAGSTTAPGSTAEAAKSSCSGSFQTPSSIDELLDGGGCVAAAVSAEKPLGQGNSNVHLSHTNMQSPSTSVAGSFHPGSGGGAHQTQPDQAASSSSSAPHTPNSTVNVNKPGQNKQRLKIDKGLENDTNQGKAGEGNDNSVQHLQRMTQSIKDTSKQDDLMKVANSQHAEYLSHSSSDNYGSQNCIAALSAACRNIIADMDSSMPKQNSGQKVQSPLGGKNTKFDGTSGFGAKSDALSGFGSGPPSVNSMGDQFVAPSSCMMTPAPPNCMPMDSFGAFPNNFNGANPMPMPDFQGKYHDFLEQSLPMQMSGRRMDEKPRKGRRRRKSEEFSTEQLISCSMPPVKPKRKYRKRSTQNPPSVESMEGPLSVDNVVFTPLSESGSHPADDMGYRSATQTPNSVPNSWGMDVKMSDSISMAMSIADGNQIEHVSQDLLDSVFSPDTTMSSTTNQDMPESGSCVPQGSSPIMHSQSPLGPPHLNNNHPISMDHKHNMYPPQSNNTVSSTGEANCPFISTSTHSVNGNVKHKDTEEAHPLEILQAQIKIQRKQFNLGETQQQQLQAAEKNNEKNSKVETALPNDLEMDNLLSSEENAWYLSEDQPKDHGGAGGGGGGLWEDLCPKGEEMRQSESKEERKDFINLDQTSRQALQNKINFYKNNTIMQSVQTSELEPPGATR